MPEAYSSPLDTDDRVQEIIADAPPEIQTRHKNLVEDADEIDAKMFVRMNKANALKEKMDALARQIRDAEQEEKTTGKSYYKETREFDDKGGEDVTRTATGYVEKLRTKYEALRKERHALMDKRPRQKWLSVVEEGIAVNGVRLVPNPNPLNAGPLEGESSVAWHEREWSTIKAARAQIAAAYDAPLTKAEAKAALDAYIDRLATSPPDIGGFLRGSTIAARGGLQIGNPNAEIGWQENFITQNTFVTDFGKSIAFLFPNELKKKLGALLDARDFSGAISAADKAPLLAKLEADLWESRRRLEAAVLACRADGIDNRNRPKDTPWPILLDCLPPEKARLVRSPTKITAAPLAPVDDADDAAPDFEDEGNDE
jgi:hypothetical protein